MSPVFDLADPESAGIAYSSYDFEYLTPHHRVDRLLKQYRLDEVIAAGETDLEKFARSAPGQKAGVLEVDVETATPNFSH